MSNKIFLIKYVQQDVERTVFLFGFLTDYHVIEIQSNFGQNIKGEENCFEPSKVCAIKIIKTCFNSRKLVWDTENSKHLPLIEVNFINFLYEYELWKKVGDKYILKMGKFRIFKKPINSNLKIFKHWHWKEIYCESV